MLLMAMIGWFGCSIVAALLWALAADGTRQTESNLLGGGPPSGRGEEGADHVQPTPVPDRILELV